MCDRITYVVRIGITIWLINNNFFLSYFQLDVIFLGLIFFLIINLFAGTTRGAPIRVGLWISGQSYLFLILALCSEIHVACVHFTTTTCTAIYNIFFCYVFVCNCNVIYAFHKAILSLLYGWYECELRYIFLRQTDYLLIDLFIFVIFVMYLFFF